MARVPRYGVHEGVKYSPRRTLIKICEICGNIIINPTRGKKYCSNECYEESNRINTRENHNPNTNFEHRYEINANKVYQPPKDEEERRRRNNYWKVWYSHLTIEQKIKYNTKKKKGATKKEDTYEDIQNELKAYGLR